MLPLFDEQTQHSAPPQRRLIDVDAAFEQLWSDWPRKSGKKPARRKFAQALMKTTFETLTDALAWQRHLPQWKKVVEGVHIYVPHLATWLHQERYNDPKPPGFRIPPERPQPAKVTPEERERVLKLRAEIDHRNHLEAMERITSGEIYKEFPRLPPGSMKVRPCECWKCRSERGE